MRSNPCMVFKRLMLFTWAAWFTLVFVTNFMDALMALGLLQESWKFASGNWAFLLTTTERYGTPVGLSGCLFAGVIIWELVALLLFWRAVFLFRGLDDRQGLGVVFPAFIVAVGLFAAFILADEIFMAYSVENTHRNIFIALVVSVLAIRLLPEDRE